MSVFIAGVSVSVVNVALPAIQRTFDASVGGLQWTVDIYTLVIACLLMLSGSLADRFGRRRTFQVGLAVFTVGSLLSGIAPSLGWLLTFRALQAVGGSMLNPVAMSIIVNTFTDRAARARAVGVWGSVLGLSLAIGPIVGGILVSGVGWRSIFWINVPIGILAIWLTHRFVSESRAPSTRRFDPSAQALLVVMLASLTYGVIEGPTHGWGSGTILGCFAVTIAAATAFLVTERRRREPLVDLRFFRNASFAGANLLAVVAFAALGGFLFLNTFYLQDARGYSALRAGVLTIPMALALAVCAQISGRLVASRGPRWPLVMAGPPIAVGALLLARSDVTSSIGYLSVAYTLFGIGSGLVTAPISNTAVSGMPAEQAGVAGAIASTGRQVGSSLGVAVVGAVVAGRTGAEFIIASHIAWLVLAGCGVAVVLIGLASTGRWALATGERARRLLSIEYDRTIKGGT